MRRLPSPRLAAVAAALLSVPVAARPCSVCGCGDPLLDASDPAASTSHLRLQLESEYLDVKSGNDEGTGVDRLRQYSLKLQAVYAPVDRLSVVVTLPFTRKELLSGGATSQLSGFGDAEVAARYALVDVVQLAAQRRQTLGVSVGTSLPTGSNGAQGADGARLDEHAQVGTGSWGPFAGLHQRFAQGDWQETASVTGRLRTTNAHGYRYGDALLWSVHFQWQPLKRLAFDGGVDGRWAAQDRGLLDGVPGALVPSTGGTVLAASPGIFWNVSGAVWLSARAQLPFYTRLVGVQEVNPTFVAGLQYQLL